MCMTCVHVGICVQVYGCVHVNPRGKHQVSYSIAFYLASLIGAGGCRFSWTGCSASSRHPAISCSLSARVSDVPHLLGLHMRAGDLNLCPRACTAAILLTEPSISLPHFLASDFINFHSGTWFKPVYIMSLILKFFLYISWFTLKMYMCFYYSRKCRMRDLVENLHGHSLEMAWLAFLWPTISDEPKEFIRT